MYIVTPLHTFLLASDTTGCQSLVSFLNQSILNFGFVFRFFSYISLFLKFFCIFFTFKLYLCYFVVSFPVAFQLFFLIPVCILLSVFSYYSYFKLKSVIFFNIFPGFQLYRLVFKVLNIILVV